jgi:hypothetical protein
VALPRPAPGLVIRYAYLWRDEARRGEESGRKDRPCVIVLSVRKSEAETIVTVAPVTHGPPRPGEPALELPAETKRRLRLDHERSWIVLDDLNQFPWPSADLRPLGDGGREFAYGFIPRTLLANLREKIAILARAGRVTVTTRRD